MHCLALAIVLDVAIIVANITVSSFSGDFIFAIFHHNYIYDHEVATTNLQ